MPGYGLQHRPISRTGSVLGLHPSAMVSLASILILLGGGLWFFGRREPSFADEI